jgi:hypothetical protein
LRFQGVRTKGPFMRVPRLIRLMTGSDHGL